MHRKITQTTHLIIGFTLSLAFALTAHAATGAVTISPTTYNFGNETVGLKSPALTVTVTNTGAKAVNVTSFQLTNSAFQLTQGIAPTKISPNGAVTYYVVLFAPIAAQTSSGTLTVNIDNGQKLTVSIKGGGTTTTAKASLTSDVLDFGTVTQGQTVSSQTVTVTNIGTQSFTLVSATTQPPFSIPLLSSMVVQAGSSLPIIVSFSPTTVGPAAQEIVLTYDSLPAQAVNLIGTITAASNLAVTAYPMLPGATQKSSYMAYFTAAGGTSPYTWQLQSGSTLPAGLTLSSLGYISGSVASSVGVRSYSFTAAASDSAIPPHTASEQFTIPVGAPTGANCNNISWNVSGTNSPILGLDVLGTGTYLGSEGGLYLDGSNVRPTEHTNFGIGLAEAIQPLNALGQPDANGKEVMIVLGESNVEIEGEGIDEDSAADPKKSPSVLVVNGALGGATAGNLSNKTSPYWTTILNNILPNHGVTAKQIVAAWLEPTDSLDHGTFPSDMAQQQSEVENEARNLQAFFPNIKLAYFSSRAYAGYSNALNTVNPEPYAFEGGFAVKWAIQDQLNGKKTLNFDPNKGTVNAPWMSWGPYIWANGLVVPSTSGHTWSCQDIQDDGSHPTRTTGKEESATQVINFFKTDPTTAPWFLAK